jgi:hypothetical protein
VFGVEGTVGVGRVRDTVEVVCAVGTIIVFGAAGTVRVGCAVGTFVEGCVMDTVRVVVIAGVGAGLLGELGNG